MQNKLYIFIGQSGAGKGTQVQLLDKHIRETRPNESIFHLETGEIFRSLIAGDGLTASQTRTLIDAGALPPAFLGIHAWSHALIAGYSGEHHVFFDGTPRVVAEVPALLSAISFYGWQAHVVYIEVGDTWAKEKMLARGRADDTEADIDARIAWFHQSVVPAIDILTAAPGVVLHRINGEQTIEQVYADIAKVLSN